MLVRETEIRDAGAGTPKATLLAWWQALQFDDASTASGYYAPGVTSEPRIAAQLRVAGAPTLAKPEVEQVRVDHGRALVYAIVVSATVTKSNRLDTFSRHPVTFHMVRHGSDWAFVDNDFLAERAAAAMAYQSGSQK